MVRLARHRKRMRQADLAAAAGVSRRIVVEIEHGRLDGVRFGEVIAVGNAVELRLIADWRAAREDLHHLTDTGHAAIVESVVRMQRADGWECHVEVIGGTGSIDVLAFHRGERMLLVVEVKTRLVDIQRTLRELGYRATSARSAAADLGWQPRWVSTLLVIGATSAQRRLVARHAALFATAFPIQGWAARRWLREPSSATAALLFVPYVHGQHRIHADAVRVRLDRAEVADRAAAGRRRERGQRGRGAHSTGFAVTARRSDGTAMDSDLPVDRRPKLGPRGG
jgi:transcriptional regulator with XRE-family HTH domain